MPQRKSGDSEFSPAAHLVAMVCCITLLTLAPIVVYGLLMVVGLVVFGDAGGPLDIILVPLISFTFALLCVGSLCPLALLLQWLRGRWRFPAWLPLAAAYPVAFALISAIMIVQQVRIRDGSDLAGMALTSLLVSCCFWTYWGPLTVSETILDLLRRPRAR
jgi:hypothetical protein